RALATHLNAKPEDLRLYKDVHGRPCVDAAVPLDFSVAHAGGTLVVAVLPRAGRIGVDIETIDPTIDPLLLARHHFAPSEIAHLAETPSALRPRAFYHIWTAKEA